MSDADFARGAADEQLRRWGADDRTIAAARGAGLLPLLAVSLGAVPGPPKYTSAELAAHVGMEPGLASRFWRAMGLPDPGPGERIFTDEDAEALATVHALLNVGGTDVEVSIQMTRVLGSSLSRVAEAMLDVRTGELIDDERADLFALGVEGGLNTQAKLLDYVWRRHMQAGSRRRLMADRSDRTPGPTVRLAVGFADLVGFTAMSQQVSEAELATIVGRFEALAFDQVTEYGGRVAKMIGDEVMFVVDDVGGALETALSLAAAYADDELLSDVRVGLAWGDVLALEGDYYGPVVNVASRIVNIAVPGSVVVAEPVYEALRDDPRYLFHGLRPRSLKDIGRVRLWRVRRAHPSNG